MERETKHDESWLEARRLFREFRVFGQQYGAAAMVSWLVTMANIAGCKLVDIKSGKDLIPAEILKDAEDHANGVVEKLMEGMN